MTYLDASAIVRIVADEPGWSATVAFLRDHEARVTSVVSTVEVPRAVARKRADAALAAVAFVDDLAQGPPSSGSRRRPTSRPATTAWTSRG